MDHQRIASFANLQAVLFDLDGTLLQTQIDFPAMAHAMRCLAQAAGVPESVTNGKDILSLVEAAMNDVSARGGDGEAFRRTAFAKLEEQEILGCSDPILLPGTRELLSMLNDSGVKIGVVTRNCRTVSEGMLAQFGLPHDVLLTRDDVTRTKPNPEHLWEALTHLGVSSEKSAMVGDHWMDIQAGQMAGCAATLGILGTHQTDWFAPCPPAALVKDLAEALPLFQRAASPQ